MPTSPSRSSSNITSRSKSLPCPCPFHSITDSRTVGASRDQTRRSAPGGANPDGLSEEERLHREVFSNEAGYLSSNVYNPVRARRQAEEAEATKLAAEWGSTPEQAREIIHQSKKFEDMSFKVRRARPDSLQSSETPHVS